LENQPEKLPSVTYLQTPEIQAQVVREVAAQYRPPQLELEGVTKPPNIAAVVAKTTALVIQQTIDIPRILVVPKGEVRSGFKPFTLELTSLNYQPPSEELWIHYMRTGGTEVIGLGKGSIEEPRIEDYIVSGLVDFDDVAYDSHADLLYDLATQTVRHFRSFLSEEDTGKVLRLHQREIARFIHVQMQHHYWESPVDYEVVITKDFTELKQTAYAQSEPTSDFHSSPDDKSNMAKYLFGGFKRSLYAVEKFHSEAERVLAVIVDREAEKWFKPAKGQFLIFYKSGADHPEYQPDFVAETKDSIYMLEPKAKNQLDNADVIAKKESAVKWCQQASAHAATYGGKPWKYALIPHDSIAGNMTLAGLVGQFGNSP
jgi:type III restriction enzyme